MDQNHAGFGMKTTTLFILDVQRNSSVLTHSFLELV